MTKQTMVDRYTAASGIAATLFNHAAKYGIDLGPLCESLEIDPKSFSDLTGRISLDRICRLLEACAVIANDEAFGLKYVENFVAGSTGPYGYGLIVAPTVRHFLQFQQDNMNFVSQASFCQLRFRPDGAELQWSFSPLIVKRDQYVDMGVALSMRRLRDIVGDHIDQVVVNLERPKPANPAIFRDYLARKVTYGNRINSLFVPQSLLAMVNPRGDEQLFRLMEIQCASLQPVFDDNTDFIVQVRELLTSRVTDESLSLTDIANYFAISERSLQRRLSDHNTSLNALRDEVRRDLAQRLLSETELSAAEISFRLGYSAPSTFTRSVHRWFGGSPRKIRKHPAVDGRQKIKQS